MTQDFIENIFTEIEIQCLNTTKNVIIRLIYRVPDSNTFFSIRNNQTFKKNTKGHKFIYVMDDYYNINILKCSKNEYIQEFLDIVMQITWFLLFLQWELKQGHYSYNET